MSASSSDIAKNLSELAAKAAQDRIELNKFMISSGEIYSGTAKLVADIVTLARKKGVKHEFLEALDTSKSTFMDETNYALAALSICRAIVGYIATDSSRVDEIGMKTINTEIDKIRTELLNRTPALPKSSVSSISTPLRRNVAVKQNASTPHSPKHAPSTGADKTSVSPIRKLSPTRSPPQIEKSAGPLTKHDETNKTTFITEGQAAMLQKSLLEKKK